MLFPPEALERWYLSIIGEVLEERVSSSRGRSVKRGVRQRFSTYKVRKWGPTNTVKNIDYKAAVVVIGKRQSEVQVPVPSLTLANTDHQELVMAK